MRVVIAGFGPFPGVPRNPSAAIAQALARRRRPALSRLDRSAHVFATNYAAVDRDMPKLFASKPDIVLIFGLAARRRHVCIETRARNAVSVLFPDAKGCRPSRGVLEPGGPTELFGHAPFWHLQGAARGSKIPLRLSRDAGRYLCNYAYWRALQRAPQGRPLVQFVHIPAITRHPRPRRRHKKRQGLTFRQVLVAAENLLIALASASKR